ncbi:hypothetical protein PoB_006182400 [Plakobranchus ocellatus]|uniref:Uncharacterized protein n=1 Tax=Plakobranchus ocellatus TaxID=259542 RepID=A0AAV4CTW0_9GAST|nr:hypothetical protein PoB_006182400 [Plakobranchus ocellatus]
MSFCTRVATRPFFWVTYEDHKSLNNYCISPVLSAMLLASLEEQRESRKVDLLLYLTFHGVYGIKFELPVRCKNVAESRILGVNASPLQGDLRLSGPPSGQGAGGGARTYDRKVPADLRADSLATVPPTPQ